MTLRDLLSEIPEPSSLSMNVNDASVGDTTVTAVTYDSRQAGPGAVFVALRGVNADGASFAREALHRGAVAVVSEAGAPRDVTRPWIQVPDARLSLAALAATLYRKSERGTHARRHHRNQRKDHDLVPPRGDFRGGRCSLRTDRHGRLSRRQSRD